MITFMNCDLKTPEDAVAEWHSVARQACEKHLRPPPSLDVALSDFWFKMTVKGKYLEQGSHENTTEDTHKVDSQNTAEGDEGEETCAQSERTGTVPFTAI